MITGVQPGKQSLFQAVGLDQFGNPAELPSGVAATWTSSDPTNTPIVGNLGGDPQNLLISITPPATAPTTGTFQLGVSATLPDGTSVTGLVDVPFLPASTGGLPVVQSFAIDQVQPQINLLPGRGLAGGAKPSHELPQAPAAPSHLPAPGAGPKPSPFQR